MKRAHLLIIGGWTEILERSLKLDSLISYIGPFKGTSMFDPSLLQYCLCKFQLPIDNIGLCLLYAVKIHAFEPLSAVVSFTEYGIQTASVIAKTLGIGGIDLLPAIITCQKDRMRDFLKNDPCLSYPFKKIESIRDLENFINQNGVSVIKPVYGSGAEGVKKISNKKELKNLEQDVELSEYIVEKFIGGKSERFSVETISCNGNHKIIAIVYIRIVGDPYFISSCYITPPPKGVSQSTIHAINKLVVKLLEKLNINNGVTHTEVKVDETGKVIIVEAQMRVGGSRIWKAVEESTGIKQIDFFLRTLKGEKYIIPEKIVPKYVVTGCSIVPDSGTISDFNLSTSFIEEKFLLVSEIEVKKGDLIHEIRSLAERRGLIIFKSETHAEAERILDKMRENFYIRYTNGKEWKPNF